MYSVEMSRKPGGTWTASLTVLALSISFGTRMTRVAKEPVGTSLGCRLTWACAAAGTSSAKAATTARGIRRIGVFLSWAPSLDRHLDRFRVLGKGRNPDGERDVPFPARVQQGTGDGVVAGAGELGFQRQGDVLFGERRGRLELFDLGKRGAALSVEEIDVDLVGADPGRFDADLQLDRAEGAFCREGTGLGADRGRVAGKGGGDADHDDEQGNLGAQGAT